MSRIKSLDELFNYVANKVSYSYQLSDDLPEHVTRQRVADIAKLRSLVLRYLRTLTPYISKESPLIGLTDMPVWGLISGIGIGGHSVFNAADILSPETALIFHSEDVHSGLRDIVLEEIESLLLKVDTEKILYRS